MACLYMLDINPLLIMSLANFTPFILFIVFFALPMLLSLIRSHLFVFAFISFTLGDGSKNIATIYVKECSYVFL